MLKITCYASPLILCSLCNVAACIQFENHVFTKQYSVISESNPLEGRNWLCFIFLFLASSTLTGTQYKFNECYLNRLDSLILCLLFLTYVTLNELNDNHKLILMVLELWM